MKFHVVLVDDEPDITENLSLLLEDNYKVTCFNDPMAFVSAFEENKLDKIHILITDLRMPKMSGIDMIKKVRSKNDDIPFIVFSGNLNKDAALEAVDLGVYRILEKPIRIEKLRSAMVDIIREQEIEIIRKETRVLMSQLRELYTSLRLVCHNYMPQEIMDRLVVEAPNGHVKHHLNFDDVMEGLETKLHKLLTAEKNLVSDRKSDH